MHANPLVPDSVKLLLTPQEAAKALSISERLLWTLTKRGTIRAVRCGKRAVRYAPADLQAFIDNQHSQN
jgi:excisionase family DNA binding protein